MNQPGFHCPPTAPPAPAARRRIGWAQRLTARPTLNAGIGSKLGPVLGLTAVLLGGCALHGPLQSDPPAAPQLPAQWQAPGALPHHGKLADLSRWWQDQGDPLLVELIGTAQQASGDIAAARTRMVQSRAERSGAGARLLPGVDVSASAYRQGQQSSLPTGTTSQLALQSAWEIDLFGANRAGRDAAQLRFEGAQAGWHQARVAVAAEVASQYYSLRSCQQLFAVAQEDAASRGATADLTALATAAGFQSPADAALARASAAEGRNRAVAQGAQCDLALKALVELSAMPEPTLRTRLALSPGVPAPALAIDSLPAQVLAQRPDLYAAAGEVAAASFEVGVSRSQRYPQLSLSGNIGKASFRSGGSSTTLSTWTIGPLALSLPVFDGGRRRDEVEAAIARYDEAVVRYQASARLAVREVEQALVNLDSTAARSADAHAALDGYRASYQATKRRYDNGLASLLELEESRRTRLAAENALVSLQNDRSAAWVTLYRAAGGGWSAPADAQTRALNLAAPATD